MKTRAAIAYAAGKPLEIVDAGSRGPESRRGAGRGQGDRHLPHRRVHAARARDPEGSFPAILGHEGAGVVVEVGAGRHHVEEGRSRHPALYARVPAVQVLPVAQDQPLHRDPRHAGQGPDARRHQPLLDRWQAAAPLHGLLDLRQPHRAAGDRAGEDPRGRAVRQGLLHRLRRDHRHRRGHLHGQGRARRQRGGVRPGRHRPQRDPGRATGGRRQDHRRRPQSGARGAGASNSA